MRTLSFAVHENEALIHDCGLCRSRISQAARDLYFQPLADRDGVFAKNFPADTPHLQAIFANFERHIEEMLLQTAGVAPVRWQAALIDFLDRIEGLSLDWYLVGSAALAVRGIECGSARSGHYSGRRIRCSTCPRAYARCYGRAVCPLGKLDRAVVRADFSARAARIRRRGRSRRRSYGVCDFGPAAAARLETVKWRGRVLRVPPLDLVLAVTEARGLTDRAAEIRRWMAASAE